MKPYSTIEIAKDGTRYLPMQIRGAQPGGLAALLKGRRLLACKVPERQKGRLVWQVTLSFTSDLTLELTSSSTAAQDWDEFGTINVDVLTGVVPTSVNDLIDLELPEGLEVVRIEVIRWQGDGLTVDSGIRLHFSGGQAFSVVAFDLPGQLLLTMPGEAPPPSWQFPVQEYFSVAFEDLP
ncbi:hypothetical protein [uncultured Stenotrophomonas sp.]|uniref:hypothetical protein n=1 Tax=uncultured Stenotrophomonas sp. TaxID=165438 RepID=UPI0028D366D7|nr:hypothetical protein [uncultured Stenotrophomonas sp.]